VNKCTVNGIDVIDDEQVPPDQIWLDAPMPNGGKVRYMFTITDHSFLRVDGEPSFFKHLQGILQELRGTVAAEPLIVADRLSDLLDEMSMFQRGEWPPKPDDAFGEDLPVG